MPHNRNECPTAKAGLGLCPECLATIGAMTESDRENTETVTDAELGNVGPINRSIRADMDKLFGG